MIRVHGTGCALVDSLYDSVDFQGHEFKKWMSQREGDGGLFPGGLVFANALSNFAQTPYPAILASLCQGKAPKSTNIGGPGIVPLIHAQQVRGDAPIQYRFSGALGRDVHGVAFRQLLAEARFSDEGFCSTSQPTPCTDVLSDPLYDDQQGERTFINTIGAAGEFGPQSLPEDFFQANILVFGGTALVPPLHDSLQELCRRGREQGAFVLVNTVYDFRNESLSPGMPWPLVEDYSCIDLLIMDKEEACKISGLHQPEFALDYFIHQGCGAVIITQGADAVLFSSGNSMHFAPCSLSVLPTCHAASDAVSKMTHPRDTTGCGDNFVGGVIDSLAKQMLKDSPIHLEMAVKEGVIAGGLALSILGGVCYEEHPGEKAKALKSLGEAYQKQCQQENQG